MDSTMDPKNQCYNEHLVWCFLPGKYGLMQAWVNASMG